MPYGLLEISYPGRDENPRVVYMRSAGLLSAFVKERMQSVSKFLFCILISILPVVVFTNY